MRKAAVVTALSFIYACLLSLGMECTLILSSACMSISFDGKSTAELYPRFLPFCLAAGIFALAAIAVILFVNIKKSDKIQYSRLMLTAQIILSFAISLPMIKLWETLFRYLQGSL